MAPESVFEKARKMWPGNIYRVVYTIVHISRGFCGHMLYLA